MKTLNTFITGAACLLVLAAAQPGEGQSLYPDKHLALSDASFIGEAAEDSSGGDVSSAGDVNGDGYEDILIGAWWNDEGGADAGQTYLIFGEPTGWAMDIPLSSSDASFIGEAAGDLSGWSVSSAGDVNGDGYHDILISARTNDEGGSNAGQTYLIFGEPTGWSMDTPLSASDASFIGEAAGDYSGYCLSSAGDVNEDGYDDILVGAWGNDEGGYNTGQTYLVLGKPTGWAMDTPLSASDASFIGEASDDRSGVSVSSAGDVNGDGYDDILIGAIYNDEGGDSTGQTYLIFGEPTGWAMDTPLSSADASFIGEAAGDLSGDCLSSDGDVNGDSYDDILIGALWNDGGATDAGQSYLILGKPTGWSMDTPLSSSDASFLGEAAEDWSSCPVSSAGDVNGDGYDDIVIGATRNDEGGIDAGLTYLILGKPTGWSMDTPLSSTDASFIGEAAGDYSGFSGSSAGDVNGDGHNDILIGAIRNDEGGPNAGQSYLNFGTCLRVSVQVTPDTTVVARGDSLWFTVDIVNILHFTLTFQAWVDVDMIGGVPYGGNPIMGPATLTRGPGAGYYGVRRGVKIPNNTPLGGPYALWVRVGWHEYELWDGDGFEFEVVP